MQRAKMFDADPAEWRNQFWGNDASAKAATEVQGQWR